MGQSQYRMCNYECNQCGGVRIVACLKKRQERSPKKEEEHLCFCCLFWFKPKSLALMNYEQLRVWTLLGFSFIVLGMFWLEG